MDCSLSGSSIHEILQARILGWAAISFSRGSSQPRHQNCISMSQAFGGGFFTTRATWEGSPDVQAGFRKGRGTRDQIANICWITGKAGEFQKNIYFCFIDYAKAFDCVDHNKLWKILKEMGIPDHLTCLLRNLYAGQEQTVRTRHRKTG